MVPSIKMPNGKGESILPNESVSTEFYSNHETSNGVRVNGSETNESIPPTVTPIAIIGLSLKFPGGASTPDSFWSMLEEGRNASRRFPSDRLDGPALYHPDATRTFSIAQKGGHFLDEDISAFDAPFFSISAAEAAVMDPQSRMLLEATYRAFENAGIPMDKISYSRTSVFSGSLSTDYADTNKWDLENGSKHSLMGTNSLLSGRLSWFFNLLGPNLTLDTACSSSLVALDLGCQSLLSGSADMGVVTGSNLLLSPSLFHLLGNFGMLSPDSKCYSFDHRANGYGRGEGIASIIIKRLPDAVRDNDTIRAVIRSTGTNHDGRTPGMSQPSKSSQALLIKETYSKAGLSMIPTRYFEAHGTGTPVGDPIEAGAIGESFWGTRTANDPIYVGSVKSNIGHTEGTSGLASVIKAILVLEKGIIPPNATLEKLNDRINAAGLNLRFPTHPTPWPAHGLRRISVNSFGASGTNAHVVLDDAYHHLLEQGLEGNHCTSPIPRMAFESIPGTESQTTTGSVEKETLQVTIFSASEKTALNRMLSLYSEQLRNGNPSLPSFIRNLTYTLNARRTWLPYRSFMILSDTRAIDNITHAASTPLRAVSDPNCAFIFTGQGAQWSGMARELLKIPAFRQNIIESNTYLRELGCTWNLLDVLVHDTYEVAISQPVLSQTLCCVVQMAIVDLYVDLGLLPIAVVGHSSGEIAAAYCTGAISKSSALKLSYYRGIVSKQAANQADCAMMAVSLSATDASQIIGDLNKSYRTPSLFLACINSPKSVTVSGDRECIKELSIILENRNIFHRQLRVDSAYHSPYMASSAEPYAKAVMSLTAGSMKGVSPMMISSVTGDFVNHQDLQNMDYWVKNLLLPVQFSDAITRLCCLTKTPQRKRLDGSHRNHLKIHVLVEIGPHAALRGPLQDTLSVQSGTSGIAYYPSLQRNHPADRTLFAVIGYMACHGFNVNLDKVNDLTRTSLLEGHRLRVLPELPEYPFDHSRKHWIKGRLGNEYRFRRHHKLDLLGKPVVDWNPLEPRWQNFLKLSEMPWIGDHKIDGAVIYPAAGMMVMAMEASKQLVQKEGRHRTIKAFKLTNNEFHTALVVPATPEGIETQLVLRPTHGDSNANTISWEYRLYSCDEGKWNENYSGKVNVEFERQYSAVDTGAEEREEVKRSHELHTSAEQSSKWTHTKNEFYLGLSLSGYRFGPSFKVMDNVTFGDEPMPQATADVNCFQWREVDQKNHYQEHIVHPTTLDGILQPALAIASQAGEVRMPTSVPMRMDELWVSATGLSFPETTRVKSRGSLLHRGKVGFECDITAFGNSFSKILVRAKRVKLRFVTESVSSTQESEHQTCYNIAWNPELDLLSTHHSFVVPSDLALHPILSLLALATFKRPDMDIIQLSNTSNGDTKRLLQQLFSTEHAKKTSLPYKKYTVLELSDIPLENVQDIVEEFQITNVASWSPTKVWQASRSESEGSDLILCPWNEDTPQFVPRVHKRLRTCGRMILFRTDADSSGRVDTEKTMALLSENGFENVQAHSAANDIAVTGTKSVASFLPVRPLKVVILIEKYSKYQETLGIALKNELARFDIPCESKLINFVDASEINPEPAYIFLSDLERPILEDLDSDEFQQLKEIFLRARKWLWLTTQNKDGSIPPGQGIIDGLARVIRAENSEAVIVTASLEKSPNLVGDISHLVRHVNFGATNQEYESEYRQVNGRFNIARIMPSPRTSRNVHLNSMPRQFKQEALGACPPLKLDVGTPGLLDGLQFSEDDTDHTLAADEVEIKTQFSGLNFKDLLGALGRVNAASLGNECAGTVTRAGSLANFRPGDRVCVFHPTAFNSYVRAKATSVTKVPDGFQLAHAVSIVLQFSTAHYALHHLAHLKRGETVLIHSGAGGTGQAAIQVAQELGAEIFTTVSSEPKKKLLTEEYGIPSDHIFYSRNTSFAQGILEKTNQRGVDVVLNSLAGESLQASWNIITSNGRFVELGRKDIDLNASLSMGPFQTGASFMALEMSKVASQEPRLVREIIELLLHKMEKGILRPISPFQILPISDVQKGMRMLQEGETMGKIVFKYSDEMKVPVSLKRRSQFYFSQNKTYVIAGGTGGIGRAISLWMAKERGAKNLILLSRSGLKRADAVALVQELRQLGVTVEAPECDICDIERLKAVLEEYQKTMPVIGGCIQASMVLKDGIFANMSYQDWRSSLRPKVLGSWNLHTLLPSRLDFFIMLSSVAGVIGSSGQANYASGNTYLDALAHYRVSQGEKATSLDLGAILDHGVVASDDRLRERLLSGGYLAGVTSPELFSLLEHSLTATQDVTCREGCQIVFGLASASEIRANLSRTTHSPMSLPFYYHILAGASQDTLQGTEAERLTQKHRRDFINAEDIKSAGNVVARALAQRLMPGHPESDCEDFDEESLRKPIQSYGIDSLMAIELRSWFALEFSADVPVFQILGEGTLASIGTLVASKSKLRSTT